MSETDAKTDPLASIETTDFVYASRGPIQSIPFRVITGEGEAAAMTTFTVDLRPGKPCRLPTGHAITKGLIAQKLIDRPDSDETNEPDPVALKDLAANDTRRVEAIAAEIPGLTAAQTTSAGKPRMDALEQRLGFKPTSNEIDAALATLDLTPEA